MREDRLLAERVARIPDAFRRLGATSNPAIALGAKPIRRFLATGVGSSRAHARFVAERLTAELGVWSECVPLSSLAAPAPSLAEDVLIVFSQGVTPNVRPLLSASGRFARVILVTAAREQSGRPGVRDTLRKFRDAGGIVRTIPADDEFGTLVRVIGPMIGYLEALRVASAVARALGHVEPPPPDVERIVRAIEGARGRIDALAPNVEGFADGLAFVALGRYGDLAVNLQQKVLEGMWLPWPPVWDLLELAHGPFQELYARRATLLALTHQGDVGEAKLLERLAGMLVPERHRLLALESTLPGSLAIFEHEALLNELMLRFVALRGIDSSKWPGRGLDAPLYDAEDWLVEEAPPGERQIEPSVLARLTTRELERAIAAGRTTAVVPLGSTEQHGAHLPIAADTLIAEALAARFCEHIDEAIRLPAIAIGCSSEHLGFAGTLSLTEPTFTAILRDVVDSLAASGFRRAFLFSAHGGNFAALARALPSLRAAAAPLAVEAFTDLGALTATLHEEASAEGISAEAAGHHAGEIETSILLALDRACVRAAERSAGFVEPTSDPQSLFYPRLAARVPGGVIGDPTAAEPGRGERYLAAWTRLLIAAYRAEKNQK